MEKSRKRKWLRNFAIIFVASLIAATIFFWWLIREPRHIPGVIGSTESRIRTYFGAPDDEGTFWLTDRGELEYRLGLQNNFPDVDFTRDSVLIKEYAWQGKSWDYRIWLTQQSGEWVVIDNQFWTAAIQF
jgi:hypothetical protein